MNDECSCGKKKHSKVPQCMHCNYEEKNELQYWEYDWEPLPHGVNYAPNFVTWCRVFCEDKTLPFEELRKSYHMHLTIILA